MEDLLRRLGLKKYESFSPSEQEEIKNFIKQECAKYEGEVFEPDGYWWRRDSKNANEWHMSTDQPAITGLL